MSHGAEVLARAAASVTGKSHDITKQKRIAHARNDFYFFCRTYLPHYFSAEPAPYQSLLVDVCTSAIITADQAAELRSWVPAKYHNLIAEGPVKAIIDVEPRGHGKTVRMSLAYPLWSVLTGRAIFPLLFSASQAMANANLQNIKDEIQENELLFEDFGELKGEQWRSAYITLSNGSAIAARGAGASVRGIRLRQHRPDLLILDDVIKDQEASSATSRDKIYHWFKRAVLPLGRDTMPIVVNTIFHNDDLPSRLLREITEGQLEGWAGIRLGAVHARRPIWPSYWTADKLLARKNEVGSLAWTTEYMNEPVAEDEQIFKESWLRYYRTAELPSALSVVMAIDPSAGAHDRSGIVVVGQHQTTLYLLAVWAQCVSPQRLVNKVVEMYDFWRPKLVLFEDIAFQRVYKQFLFEKAREVGLHLPLRGVSPGGVKKEIRLMKLSPLVENGAVLFPEGKSCQQLIDEMLTFPKGEFDDLLDALYYAVEAEQGKKKIKVLAFGKRGKYEQW